jgi:hypothetical protein
MISRFKSRDGSGGVFGDSERGATSCGGSGCSFGEVIGLSGGNSSSCVSGGFKNLVGGVLAAFRLSTIGFDVFYGIFIDDFRWT